MPRKPAYSTEAAMSNLEAKKRALYRQYFSRLSVPRLLSGRSGSEKIKKEFLSRGICYFANVCRGLLYFADAAGRSVVWNPSTDEEREIPSPGTDVVRSPEVGYTYTEHNCFGYDTRSDDFKVLRLVKHVYQTIEEDGQIFDVGRFGKQYLLYSMKSNRWVDFPCPDAPRLNNYGCVYLNGWCFWVASNRRTVEAFNFVHENFYSFPLDIPVPSIGGRDGYKVIMVEVDEEETLGFVVYKNSWFELWTCFISKERSMPLPAEDDNGCVWNKRWEFQVNFPEECGTMMNGEKGKPLLLYKNEEELLLFLLGSNNQLMVYSSAAQELKLLPHFSRPVAVQLISYHQTSLSPFLF
ncbi:hypothetical protein C2S51_022041 [Perilla frutescens var. frutescens]|nr:hypothetical protein C2S51_022041 [Perilla frutescens var. frutescens]